jgi:hypothetical protein
VALQLRGTNSQASLAAIFLIFANTSIPASKPGAG